MIIIYHKCYLKVFAARELVATRLRTSTNVIAPRFKTKFMKNSLEYQESVLWNLVNDNEDCGHLSLRSLLRCISNKDYFKDYNFKAIVTGFRQNDFFCY